MMMKSLAVLTAFLAPVLGYADSTTVVTLMRVNFHTERLLHYDLMYDGKSCQIDTNNPFDVYYENLDTGTREPEFSHFSQQYFGPILNNGTASPARVELNFTALEEVEKEMGVGAEIMVSVRKVDGRCVPQAEISYGPTTYVLEHIDINVRKAIFADIVVGVNWVSLRGRSPRGPVTDCVAGTCTN